MLEDPSRIDAVVVELGLMIFEQAKTYSIVKRTSTDLLGALTRLFHNQAAGLQHIKQHQRLARSNKKLGQIFLDSLCSTTKYDKIIASCKPIREKFKQNNTTENKNKLKQKRKMNTRRR